MRDDVALAFRSDIAVSIFANVDFSDTEFAALSPVSEGPELEYQLAALATEIQRRGLRNVGVMGRVDGTPEILLNTLPDDGTRLNALRAAFLCYCTVLTSGDEIFWLERLHALPDTRK
jgi:hypothetical protein